MVAVLLHEEERGENFLIDTLRRMAATVIQPPRPRARCHACIVGQLQRPAHGWCWTAATVAPATSSKSSVAVADLEHPEPLTRSGGAGNV